MNERAIRVRDNEAPSGQEGAPVQSVAPKEERATNNSVVDLAVARKVDKLRKLEEQLAQERKAAKDRQADLNREIGEIKGELTEFAEKNGMKTLSGLDSVMEFTPSTSRAIDAHKFLKFLSKIGSKALFWEYATIPVGKAVKDFGEKVLENEGCLSIDSNEFGNQKTYPKVVS